MRTRTPQLVPTIIMMAILLGSIVATMGFPIENKALAYKSKLNQAASLENACGNGELVSSSVLCQNLLSQIKGEGNAANSIGLQTGGSKVDSDEESGGDRLAQPIQPHTSSTTTSVVSPSDPLGSWSSWHSLEGVMRSNNNPQTIFNSATTNISDSSFVFVVGTDNALYSRLQQDNSDPATWLPWQRIGGAVRANSDPVVINDAFGITVFVVGTDNALWYTQQNGINTFSAFQSLGGTVDPNTSPAVIRASNGRLNVFVVGNDKALWYRSQNAAGSPFWSDWQSLGGTLRDNTDPAVAPVISSLGKVQVFVVGIDNSLYTRVQTAPGSSTWTAYLSLGGVVDPNTSPAASFNLPETRIEVFVIGTDNVLWHIRETASGSNTWSGWVSIDPAHKLRDNSDPVVIRNPGGRLQAFVVSSDNRVFYTFQLSPGSTTWSVYETIAGGTVRINTSPGSRCLPDPCNSSTSPLQVFVAGNDGALWHSWRSG